MVIKMGRIGQTGMPNSDQDKAIPLRHLACRVIAARERMLSTSDLAKISG
jgi:hypothetical protein